MRYRLEIWQYHHLHTFYEDNNIKKVLKWYKKYWQWIYEFGDCTFYLFENGKELDFDKCNKLGFYD